MLVAALRTDARHRLVVSAVMAPQLVRALVISQRDGAIAALNALAAGPAQHHRRISAAIQKNDRLLASLQTRSHFFAQATGKNLFFAGLLEFLPHIHQFDARHGALLHSLRQLDQLVAALLRVVERLQGGCRRNQEYNSILDLAAHQI